LIAILWDSSVLTKAPQRFKRDLFLRILKAEILIQLQQRAGRTIPNNTLLLTNCVNDNYIPSFTTKEMSFNKETSIKGNVNNETVIYADQFDKISLSKKRYLDRKRLAQQPIVSAGLALVGQRVSMYDESRNNWRSNLVKECIVKWIENGTFKTNFEYVPNWNVLNF
jgi:hypothetical protein